MRFIIDEEKRVSLVTDERDEFGSNHENEHPMSIEKALALKKQLSDAIDFAVKARFGFDA